MHLLSEHIGTWIGTNRFRLMPSDPPAESPATARLSVGAGGNVVVVAYTWVHPQDGEQDGLLLLGSGEEPGSALTLWGDSWHQKPGVAQLHGEVSDAAVTVGYTYAPGWEWRITLSAEQPDVLRWRMDNVVPADAASAAGGAEGLTYWAMEAELRRA